MAQDRIATTFARAGEPFAGKGGPYHRAEMALLRTRDFSGDDCSRGKIERRRWKNLQQTRDLRLPKEDHQVHDMSQAGFAVDDRSHTTADKVAHPQQVQRANKQQRKLSFGYGGKIRVTSR